MIDEIIEYLGTIFGAFSFHFAKTLAIGLGILVVYKIYLMM